MNKEKRTGRVKCTHCGQEIGFEVAEVGRYTQRIKCPICKKDSWALLESVEDCISRLIICEESNLSPKQISQASLLFSRIEKQTPKEERKLIFPDGNNVVMKLTPRNDGDTGGFACMPLKSNVPKGQNDWKLIKCPECGKECWQTPLLQQVVKQGAVPLCTNCALKMGLR